MTNSTTSLILPAPAKINLFLHILGRREDGYHLLQTVFQILDYSDELKFTYNTTGAITISPDIPGLPTHDNLIWQAAQRLQSSQGVSHKGVHIQINKRIPMGGGLGGGSSNAATTLVGLNKLWETNLSTSQLAKIGLELGADIPIFIEGNSAWAEGIGENLTPIKLPSRWYLVVAPNCHVSTANIFQNKELTRNTSPIRIAAFLEGGGQNDCEPLVRKLYPEVDNALIWLSQFGEAKLTGTGACAFVSFQTENDANLALKALPQEFNGFVAKGVNQSPLHV
ncbi:MAG: 4-(cytidine 5'-diphospho)-2-C-methyl-D-erythritol kinase [Pseudomonadales bacterium]|nr:4-(cytidine 5'-diphospho)-2-C-methyl-D-erythritol kinase [Pseudomonadales bacterium]